MNRPKIIIEDLFDLTGSVIYNPDSFSSSSLVSTDTRTIKKNSIFVALKGDKFDGHLFVKEAVKKGARAIVINKNKLKDFDRINVTIVTVKDTTKAYGELARIWRNKLSSKIIGITGSNGKTSTKEILATLLAEKYKVSKTKANNNNHIGVPLTILETGNDTEVLVLELGTNHFGEIKYTSEIAAPDFALITNIGESHLEYLKNLEGVANEKTALLDETEKKGGLVFINTDDPILKRRAKSYKNKVTFGFRGSVDVKGEVVDIKNGKTVIRVYYKNKYFKSSLPLFGITNAKNFLSAAVVALEMGLSFKQIKQGAEKLTSVDKRLNVKMNNGFILINDTYNANPLSMKSAFEFMDSFKNAKRKIVILGDMFELGSQGKNAHKELSGYVVKNKINEVYTIGDLMKILNKELKKNSKVISSHFNEREKLAEFLKSYDLSGAVVLLKGSRGMKMDEFLKVIDKES